MPNEELVPALKAIGLTEYEARAYLALCGLGGGSPRSVARISGIPYPSAYDALKALCSKGWAEVARTRPSRYRARPPSSIRVELQEKVDATFGAIEKLYESLRGEGRELLYTLTGRDAVRSKVKEMLRGAKEACILVMPSQTLLEIAHPLREMVERGVKLRIVTDEPAKEVPFKGAEVRVRNSLLAVDMLVDDREALIGLPDLSACGWVDSRMIAVHFQEFIELLWKEALA